MLRELEDISVKDLLIDSIKDPFFAFSAQHEILIWNKAAAELTGMPPKSIIGLKVNAVFDFVDENIFDELLLNGCVQCHISINGKRFKIVTEKISEEIFKGSLYPLDHGILKTIPVEYLVEVINASPISAIVFNLDGSILYSNNAYQKVWNLTDDDLIFVNEKYNLFLDKQLEDQGLIPIIKEAFQGEIKHSSVFEYSFNSTTLGRTDENKANRLIAHLYPIHDEQGRVIYIVLNFLDVTEQAQMQDAYKESRERLQLALKGGDLGTWDWNMLTGEMIYNKRWATMLGYDLEEVHQIKWEGLLHPDDQEESLRMMDVFISSNEDEYESEYRLRTKKGEYIWILDRGQIMKRDENGKPLRSVGTHLDITERKLNLQKIEESEAKYRRLVENAPIGIALIVDEKIQYINEALAKLGEVDDPKSVEGLSIKDFMIGEERYAKFKEREELVLQQGKNAPLYTTQFRTVKGGVVDVEIASIPIEYQGKRAMQVLINDISDRKSALKELARSQKLLDQLFRNSPMGIVFLDNNFNVKNVNLGFEKIFGYTGEEVKGKSLLKFIVPPELYHEGDTLNKSAISGKIDYIQSYRIDKEGNKKHLLIYALPIMEKDEHIGIFGIYVDIQQRVLAEEELKIRNLELDNFVYKVSHDLRAPLASILGLINLTKLEGADSDKEYYIDLMEGQVNKLDHFIRDILSHSKNLKMSVAADIIDFNEIVQKCFDDLGYMKASSKVVREISIDDVQLISDKWRISEIFRNLIGNAIKYRNQEVDENLVAVTVTKEGKGCRIDVKDNGIGIARDKLPHVMEMFYRGAETSDGSGIGLYIVQKAVEKLEGNISIESEPKFGSTFSIWLPSL